MLEILFEAALRATLIAAAALGALALLHVRAVVVRHRVCTVVMLAMLAMPLWIAWTPEIVLHVLPPTPLSASGAVASPSGSDVQSSGTMTRTEPAIERAREAAEIPLTVSWNWRAWLLAIYLVGAVILLARLAIGTVRVSLLARDASVVNGRLTSAHVAAPLTFGLLEPSILLPEGWDRWPAARLAVVLDHERAHVGRHDPLVQWLALLNRALFWFHPLAWWLDRYLAALAEEACDAAVLARGHDPADYSEHLLDIARMSGRRPMPHVVGMPMPGSALPKRIAKILEGGVQRPGSRAAVAGAVALATLAAATLGTITLGQEPPLAQEVASPRSLLEVYELALQNDPVVRDEAARQELLIRAAEAYFDVLAAEETLATQDAARAALSRQLEQAERRFEVGLIGITELQETQAAFDRAVASSLGAERALASAQETLREIAGEDVGELSPLVEDLPLNSPDPGVASEMAYVQALRQAVRSSQTALRATQAGFEVGTRTTVDVLTAENNLRQTETAYALSRYDYVLDVLRLQQAAGGLTGQSLEEVETWFE